MKRVLKRRKVDETRSKPHTGSISVTYDVQLKPPTSTFRWVMEEGFDFEAGTILAEALGPEQELIGRIIADHSGTLVQHSLKDGEPFALVCMHPSVSAGLCVCCGKAVLIGASYEKVTIGGCVSTLSVSKDEGANAGKLISNRLLERRKLSLVLDIDNTLLECTKQEPPHEGLSDDVLRINLLDAAPHWIKMRPGLRNFLSQAAPLFEMHLYTNGTREYGTSLSFILSTCISLNSYYHRCTQKPERWLDCLIRSDGTLEIA